MTLTQWRGTLTWAQVARKLSDAAPSTCGHISPQRLYKLRTGAARPLGDEMLALEALTEGRVITFEDGRLT